MKKSILLILILMMLLSLTSCGSKEEKCPDGMTCNNLDKWIGVEKTLDKDTYDGDVFFVGEDLEAGTYLITNSRGKTQVLVYKDKESYENYREFDRVKLNCPTCVIGDYWSFNQHGDEKYVFLEEGNLAVFYGDRCDFTKYDPLSQGILYSGTYYVPTSIEPGMYTLQSDVVLTGAGVHIALDIWAEGVLVYLFQNLEDYYNYLIENKGRVEYPDDELIEKYMMDDILLCPEAPFSMDWYYSDTKNVTLNEGMVVVVTGGSATITRN